MWSPYKKEEQKEIQQTKELIIKKRISALYDKMYLIYDTCTDENCTQRIHTKYSSCDIWYQYKLNTIYGIRYLLVNEYKDKIFYGKDFKEAYFTINLANPKNGFIKIFEINIGTYNNNLSIEPKPMVELTPKEIDLAILEFEEAIEKSYQLALTRKSKHDECVKYFSNESEN